MYRNEPKAELYARVAQFVEHLTCKQGVVGPIPALGKWLFWPVYINLQMQKECRDNLMYQLKSSNLTISM